MGKSACSSSVVCGGQLLQLRHEVALQRQKTLLNKTVTFFNCYSWSLKGWHRCFAFRLVSDRIMRCSETPKLILFPNWRFAGNNDQVFPVTAVNGRHWSIILSSVFQLYYSFCRICVVLNYKIYLWIFFCILWRGVFWMAPTVFQNLSCCYCYYHCNKFPTFLVHKSVC